MLADRAWAQDPLEHPDLSLQAGGVVLAMVHQPDGGLVFGGSFETVDGLPRAGLARLKPDGSLDTAWNPPLNSGYKELASCPDGASAGDAHGAVYVNSMVPGQFGEMPGLVKLIGSSAAIDPTWTHRDYAYALACGPGGTLYVANSGRVVRISAATGAADPSWVVFASYVSAIAFDASGSVYVAGRFADVNGKDRDRIAKLSAAGKVDTDWVAVLPGTPDDAPAALAVDADGNVFVGGPFGVQKLASASGVPLPTWQASAGNVYALALAADGSALYAGGWFSELGGQQRAYLARLSPATGIADPVWHSTLNGSVNTLATDADGSLRIGGSFDRIGEMDRTGIATLDPAGAPVPPMVEILQPGVIHDLAARPDQSILAGGNFIRVDGLPRRHALHLFVDGTLDPDWAPSLPLRITKLATAANGVVYAAGDEPPQDGQRTLRITKVSEEGLVDPTWTSRANGRLRALVVDPFGQLLVVGDFTAINGTPRNSIARISAMTGEVDATWDAEIEGGHVAAIASDADGRLYVGGSFTHIGGVAQRWLARLSASDGGLDTTWIPDETGPVYAIALDVHGDLYTGGQGPFARKLSPLSGSALPEWRAELDAIWSGFPWAYYVSSIATDANGTVYLRGYFGVQGEFYERSFARFSGQNGLLDAGWRPPIHSEINAAIAVDANRLYVGGWFDQVGDSGSHQAIAAFETSLPDRLFAAGFESWWPMPMRSSRTD